MFLGLLTIIMLADTPFEIRPHRSTGIFGFQFSISNIQTIPSDLFSGKSVLHLPALAARWAFLRDHHEFSGAGDHHNPIRPLL